MSLRVKGKKLMQKEKGKRRGGSGLWALVLWTPMATFPVMKRVPFHEVPFICVIEAFHKCRILTFSIFARKVIVSLMCGTDYYV